MKIIIIKIIMELRKQRFFKIVIASNKWILFSSDELGNLIMEANEHILAATKMIL